jgi:hypothetical protein
MELERHWEWRAFGKLPLQVHAALAQANRKEKKNKLLLDHYIWRPGCRANIKIRRKKLKIKELVRTTGDGFELWIESRALKYRFPLAAAPAEKLVAHLGINTDLELLTGCPSADALIEILTNRHPEISVVTIRKRREHYLIDTPEGPVSLETARISRPLDIESFCIESDPLQDPAHEIRCLRLMRKIQHGFDLSDSLRVMGYVGFLECLVNQESKP